MESDPLKTAIINFLEIQSPKKCESLLKIDPYSVFHILIL